MVTTQAKSQLMQSPGNFTEAPSPQFYEIETAGFLSIRELWKIQWRIRHSRNSFIGQPNQRTQTINGRTRYFSFAKFIIENLQGNWSVIARLRYLLHEVLQVKITFAWEHPVVT